MIAELKTLNEQIVLIEDMELRIEILKSVLGMLKTFEQTLQAVRTEALEDMKPRVN